MRLILLIVFCGFAVNLYAAPRLIDYMDTQDTYLIAYINADSIRSSDIYYSIKSNLPSPFDKSDIIAAYYPTGLKKGITENNLSELALCIDIAKNRPLMKETIFYQLAIRLNKAVSKRDVVDILINDSLGGSKFTTKEIVVGLIKVIQIISDGNSMYVYMPDSKTIFASDYLHAIVNLSSRYKAKNPIPLPERMKKQKELIPQDSSAYLIAALPPALRDFLESDDEVNPSSEEDQSEDMISILRTITKNFIGLSVTLNSSDKITINATAIFADAKSAGIFNSLITQYMPLFKLQAFMTAKNNTEAEFLNNIVNETEGSNTILNFSVSKDDIKGIMSLFLKR